MDTEYDRVRMVRDNRFQYLYNYLPGQPYYQNIAYRLSVPMMKEFLELRDEGKLDTVQMAWFKNKPVEELYDLQDDPYELHNLANNPLYKDKLIELRTAFQTWTRSVGDMGAIPEKEMIRNMWEGKNEAPVTALPELIKSAGGVKLSCSTKGASIGYRILKAGMPPEPEIFTIQSWDFGIISKRVKNGNKESALPVWQVYNGEFIHLQEGDTLKVNAQRIGYKPAIAGFIGGK